MYVHPDLLCAEAAIRRARREWWEEEFQEEYRRLHRLFAMYRRPGYARNRERRDRLEYIECEFRKLIDRWQTETKVTLACLNEQTVFLAYYLYIGRTESLLEHVTTYVPLPPFVLWMWGEPELDRLRRIARRLIPTGQLSSGKPVDVVFHPKLCDVSRVIVVPFTAEEVRALEFLYVPPRDD